VPPAGDSDLTTAVPERAEPGTAASATDAAVGPAEPGAGQARTAADTATVPAEARALGAAVGWVILATP
jgi:hypothetical protein